MQLCCMVLNMIQQTSIIALICLAWLVTANDYFHGKVPKQVALSPQEDQEKQMDLLMVAAADLIHGTNNMVWKTMAIRQASDQCASFEIGFVYRTMEESYRKMIDMYNTTVLIGSKINNRGQIYNLQKVEQFYFDIVHLSNMMHEIERKYKMDTVYNDTGMFEDTGHGVVKWTPQPVSYRTTWRPKVTKSWWMPIEYGWNKDYYW